MSGLTSAFQTVAFEGLALFVAVTIILFSIRRIGPTEVGLVTKRLSGKKLTSDNPVGFLVITKEKAYGLPVSPELKRKVDTADRLTPESFGLEAEQLDLVRISPQPRGSQPGLVDMIGIVTAFEGDPLQSGDIASRLGGFTDVERMEQSGVEDGQIIETLLGNKNHLHNNYQDFQAFLDNGGRIGLQ